MVLSAVTQTAIVSDGPKLIAEPPANNLDGGAAGSAFGKNDAGAHSAYWQQRSGFFADMSERTPGNIVKRQNPVVLPDTATVQSACRAMRDQRIGAVLVTGADGRLAGLFTGRDAVCRVVAEALVARIGSCYLQTDSQTR